MRQFEVSDRDAVLVSACRTPIGRLRGGLSPVRPDDLLALAIKEAVARARIDGAAVQEVFAGCANQAGEDNRNVARMARSWPACPNSVPGVTVNRLCASGLEAVVQATRRSRCGEAEPAAGRRRREHERAPWSWPAGPAAQGGQPHGLRHAPGLALPKPRMEALSPRAMGETAENLAEQLGISRADQDALRLAQPPARRGRPGRRRLRQRAVAVEIADARATRPCSAPTRARAPTPRSPQLAKLKPAFRAGGSVTAGNSSTLNDGAAALVWPRHRGQGARAGPAAAAPAGARAASAGVDPRIMGIGPVPAIEKLLARHRRAAGDLDLLELNEAFAAQVLAVLARSACRRGGQRTSTCNGGAIALGHPLGCSAARGSHQLLHELKRTTVASARHGQPVRGRGPGRGRQRRATLRLGT
jgi:acetyl-CoA acyltransferase